VKKWRGHSELIQELMTPLRSCTPQEPNAPEEISLGKAQRINRKNTFGISKINCHAKGGISGDDGRVMDPFKSDSTGRGAKEKEISKWACE